MDGLFHDYTVRLVALGAALLGALGGLLGTFALLRRQSLLGDAVSHAALPGIALAFLLTGSRSLEVLLAGAAASGLLAAVLLTFIVQRSRIRQDAALGLILSVFFGFGMVLLTFLQKRPDATQAGLDRFLFGQASAILAREVWLIAVPAAVCLLATLLLWKELAFIAFDRDTASVHGLPVRRLELLLTAMTVVTITVGLQTVGVVLMSALLVAPAAAARQWTDRLSTMAALAAAFGAAGGVGGAVLSSAAERLPTGPTVVLLLIGITALSLLAAPRRGVLWAAVRRLRNRSRLRREAILSDLYELSRQHDSFGHPHAEPVIAAMRNGAAGVRHALQDLEGRGWVRRFPNRQWALTAEGHRHAEEFHRLIETQG